MIAIVVKSSEASEGYPVSKKLGVRTLFYIKPG